MRNNFLFCSCLLLLGFFVQAEQFTIESDKLVIDPNTSSLRYQGKVVMKNEELRISADELKIVTEEGEDSQMKIEMKEVSIYGYTSDEDQEKTSFTMSGKNAIFQGSRYLEVTNMVSLVQADNIIEAEIMTYDREEGTISASKIGNNKVRMTISIENN